MDIIESPPFKELQKIYAKYFSLGYLDTDINTKFALISLTAYLTSRFKKKNPDVTAYAILKKIAGDNCSTDFIKGVAVIVEDYMYGCKEFPTFDLEPKDIPGKIKEILKSYMPF